MWTWDYYPKHAQNNTLTSSPDSTVDPKKQRSPQKLLVGSNPQPILYLSDVNFKLTNLVRLFNELKDMVEYTFNEGIKKKDERIRSHWTESVIGELNIH